VRTPQPHAARRVLRAHAREAACIVVLHRGIVASLAQPCICIFIYARV
jgi:hypothetical protein